MGDNLFPFYIPFIINALRNLTTLEIENWILFMTSKILKIAFLA